MDSGYAVLGPNQYFLGYSLLLCSQPATELDELEPLMRRQFLDDMARLAAAVRRVVRPYKLNYEALGNQVHHLHWHIFPRTLDEPLPTEPVWRALPDPELATLHDFDPDRHAELLAAMRQALHAI